MVIFPLAPDQTIAQMWSNGARGGASCSNDCAIISHTTQYYKQNNVATTSDSCQKAMACLSSVCNANNSDVNIHNTLKLNNYLQTSGNT